MMGLRSGLFWIGIIILCIIGGVLIVDSYDKDMLKFQVKCIGIIILICIVIITPFELYHVGFNTGSGEQIGYISEVANSGILWRPDQVHLINSEPTYSKSQTTYAYGVNSTEITKLARQYVKSHERVIVTYREEWAVPSWEYHSNVIITDIRPSEVEK